MSGETRSIQQQLIEGIVSAINAASDIPNVDLNRSWELEPEELDQLGAIVLAARSSVPAERQLEDDPADDRSGALIFVLWATDQARADAIMVRIRQLVCCTAPVGEQSPFFRLAKRIRPGPEAITTTPSNHARAELHLYLDFKQLVTDPTRWK